MLTDAQRAQLGSSGFRIGAAPLDEIEKAGGSLRCCVGEIFRKCRHVVARRRAPTRTPSPPNPPLEGEGFQSGRAQARSYKNTIPTQPSP
jgi:hypothetical protein